MRRTLGRLFGGCIAISGLSCLLLLAGSLIVPKADPPTPGVSLTPSRTLEPTITYTPSLTFTASTTPTTTLTPTITATISKLQAFQTATWNAVTARAQYRIDLTTTAQFLAPSKTEYAIEQAPILTATAEQRAADRQDTATWAAINAIVLPTDAPTQKAITQIGDANSPLAKCRDGSYWSGTEHRGACSGHKGVAVWYR